MIGYLEGVIKDVQPSSMTLLVGSVGYELQVIGHPNKLRMNESAQFFVHTLVREDEISLYGFETRSQRDTFRKLISISGLGPKLALAILNRFSIDELIRCVGSRDLEKFKTIPGIGAKKGEKLLLELKSKLKVDEFGKEQSEGWSGTESAENSLEMDVYKALVQLGYKNLEIQWALKKMREVWGEGLQQVKITEVLPKVFQWMNRGVEKENPLG